MVNTYFSKTQLRRMIIPLIIEQILVMLVGMADTMMISNVGEAAISGVALVDMLNTLIITVLLAIGAGGAIITAQYLGNQDKESASLSAGQLIRLSGMIALALMVLCLVFQSGILNLIFGKVEADVMQAASLYFMVSCLSFPFLGIYNSISALYRSSNRTDITMKVSLLMNAINIVGNALGVFVLRWGVLGVAIPTLISRAVAAVIIFLLYVNNQEGLQLQGKIIHGDKEMTHRILALAIPNGIENGLFTLGRVLVTGIVALFGTSQIAANGVAGSLNQIAILVVNSINLAIVSIVGQCMGAQQSDVAASYTKQLMKISYLATAGLSFAMLLIAPWLLSFYELSWETRQLSLFLIHSHNLMATVLHPTSFNLANSLRAAGDVKFTMVIGIASMVVFRLGTAWLFGIVLNYGILGVWLAMGMDWLGRSVAFTLRFKQGKWKKLRMI